jgi:hypothetical protein
MSRLSKRMGAMISAGVLAAAGMACAQPAGQAWRPWDDPDWRSRGQEVGGSPAAQPAPSVTIPPRSASSAPIVAAPLAAAAPAANVPVPALPLPLPLPQPVAVASQPPAPAMQSPPAAVQLAPTAARLAAAPVGSGRVSAPPAGKSQVVFFRNSSIMGGALSFSVREQGHGLVKLGMGSYVVVTMEPGGHNFTVKSEAEDTLRIELEPDETYYVQETMGMGVLLYRPRLSLSDVAGFNKYPKLHLSTQKPTDTD